MTTKTSSTSKTKTTASKPAAKTSKTSTSKSGSKGSPRTSRNLEPKAPVKEYELPSPLNEVDDGTTDQTALPNRDVTGEVGGDRKMDRGRLVVPPAPAQPLPIHNLTRRNDHDALTGHRVEITEGEHKGKFGIFEKVESWEKDGYPAKVIVSLKNVTGLLLSLPYKAVRHVPQIEP